LLLNINTFGTKEEKKKGNKGKKERNVLQTIKEKLKKKKVKTKPKRKKGSSTLCTPPSSQSLKNYCVAIVEGRKPTDTGRRRFK